MMTRRVAGAVMAVLLVAGGVVGCSGARRGAPEPVGLPSANMAETTPRVVGLRGATPRGWLMICGGGVRDEHERMYRDFFALADKADASPVGEGGASGKRTTRIGVVPTATGAESRGGDTLELLRRYAEGREVVMVPLFKEDLGKGDDASIAELIASCDGLWFVGGDQSRITAVFRPDGRDTLAYRATLRVLARGGVIAGTSAGAAMMTDPMITGGTSEDALEHGVAWTNDVQEGQGVGLAPGMGYLQGVLVDQHFLERGRLGRLIVAMHATGTARAFGVGEDAAFVVDLARGEGFSIGPSKGPTAGWCGVVEVQRPRARQAIMFGGSH